MGFSCKSKTAIAVCNSTQDPGRINGGMLESFRFRELEAATGSFARENLIRKASHGLMYRASLHDGRVVAVKRPDAGARSHEDAEAFYNEVQILSKLFSRRLVNLLGCSYDGREKLLVLEHMESGTLHENLLEPVDSGMKSSLSWSVRVKLALDIAKAIRALHASSPPIIHRNIRTTNVFLDRDGNARLGDFCLAKCLHESEPPRRSVLISIPETATESEDDHGRHSEDFDPDSYEDSPSASVSDPRISPKTDVFSFGVILLEIMSGRSAPDADHHVGALRLLDWALPLIKRGHFTAICDPRVAPCPDSAAVRLMGSVAARCVRPSSVRRPSMDEVVHCLTKASKLTPEPTRNPTSSELTTTSSSRAHQKLRPTEMSSSGKERLISHHVDSSPTSTSTPTSTPSARLTIASSAWTRPSSLQKKRTIVFRLSRFFARKFRIGARRSFHKLPVQKLHPRGGSTTPLKGAQVSDDDLRERSVVQQVLQHKRSMLASGRDHKTRRVPTASRSPRTFDGSSGHRSGKSKFVRL